MGLWAKSVVIFNAIREHGKQSIRSLADHTGLSKSSVHRHTQAMARRDCHPESWLWETPEGRNWLIRLVVATLFMFGLKRGVGAETLSEFPLAVLSLLLTVPVAFALNQIVHRIAHVLGFEGFSLIGFLSRQEGRGGAIGAAFMATTFTITSFSTYSGCIAANIQATAPPQSCATRTNFLWPRCSASARMSSTRIFVSY